jgi:signal transduction histidine kinase
VIRAGGLSLPARLLAILALVLLSDFAINALLFKRSSAFALREADASAQAERLGTAYRTLDAAARATRPALARALSGPALRLSWSDQARRPGAAVTLSALQDQLIRHDDALADARLQLHLVPIHFAHQIDGTMVLSDGSLVTFEGTAHGAWVLQVGEVLRMMVPGLVLAGLAGLLVHATLRPLRQLVRASRHVGTPHARPIAAYGPREVLSLIDAFNAMQRRIDDLLDSNTETMLAICHDMRTPLARVQLRLDALALPDDERRALDADLTELGDLFASVQDFVQADQPSAPATRADLASIAQSLVDGAADAGRPARYSGPDRLVAVLSPLALRRALTNLVENALHYGGSAHVLLMEEPGAIVLRVEDDGPGIPEPMLGKVLQPFTRLDEARARNTAGLGLGLAIVERTIRGQGGQFTLANRPGGGLAATIRLPRAAD